MKRQLLGALACGLAALPAFAAADLDAVLLHESRTVTADGVTRTTMYRERMVRRDGHVWVERVLPVAAAGGGHDDDHHGHDHDHGAGHARQDPPRAGVQPAAAHAGHKHFNFQAAARHVTYDGKTARIEYVDAATRTVVSVPPAEYETTGFDGSWDNAYYVTPPSQLKRLAAAKRGDAPGTRWYEQAVESPGARGVNRILWSERLQAPLSVEYRSADGRVVRKLTLTQTPASRREPLPWQALAGYAHKEYADYLD